ncbi:hypothetical protein ACI3L1_15470 [Deinococcus sp. SM5_A1]|uniref:hypothetical protein n=1 Tax=Deinococcus sp. SM5_A1 TaxID=3379094 RepID=UPI00385D47D4
MKNSDVTAPIAALLEKSGMTPETAAISAQHAVRDLANLAVGTGWGHLTPNEPGHIWTRAARAGRRRLVLEIVAEETALDDDTGRINVTVLMADTWPKWTDHQATLRGATHALPSVPGWNVIDTATDDTSAQDRTGTPN